MEAQNQIFLWIAKSKEVEEFYTMSQTLYNQVLDTFDTVTDIAEKILILHKKKQQGNCKFLSERIVSYNAKPLKQEIKKTLAKIKTFMVDALSGFYCSLCNSESQKYIDTEKSQISYSQNFCRGMIENTLPSVKYIHDHFVKLSTLVIGFITKCNYKGEFIVSEQVPQESIFQVTPDYLKMLKLHDECRDNRNEKQWVSSCSSICKDFRLTVYPKVLSGQYEYFYGYLISFNKLYQNYLNSQKEGNSINPDDIVSDDMNRRILQANSGSQSNSSGSSSTNED